MSPSILILVASKVINLQTFQQFHSLKDISLTDVILATNSSTLSTNDLPRSAFTTVISLGPAAHHSISLLSTVAATLQPDGRLVIQDEAAIDIDEATTSLIKKNLLLSGFINATPENGCIRAEKPNWDTGAKQTIKVGTNGTTNGAWTFNLADEDELVDTDELLTEQDLLRPAPANDDCEVGASGRKACDNCTCGRADGEVKKLTKDMLENPQSGCGSCGLGDAFRCAGCPYKGLPAFEMGKKIELPSDFLMADLE